MGKLIEQPIKALFNGVSQQPDVVRLPSQMNAIENALLTVVNGFEKRPPTKLVGTADVADPMADFVVHEVDRDANEKYLVLFSNANIEVFDAQTGDKQAVTIDNGGSTYLGTDPANIAAFTVADYTFVANRSKTVVMAAAGATATIEGPAKKYQDLPQDNTAKATYLTGTYGTGNWARGTSDGFAIGDIWKIEAPEGDPKGYRFVKCESDYSWVETVDPNGQNSFDDATMPWTLISEGAGSFRFKRPAWNARSSGDETTAKPPKFVGSTISDVFFFRERLGFLTKENAVLSQTGDTFNFWPAKAYDIGDSDPVDRAAGSSKVSLLRHAAPFNRSLFITADNAQFELSSGTGPMTPREAQIDEATAYKADPTSRPFVMGNELYFAAQTPGSAQVMEYYYQDSSVSNVAASITQHVPSYLPKRIARITGDANLDMLFVLGADAADRDKVYVYRAYWDGEEKKQSAWSVWTFEGAYIHGIAVMDSLLYLVLRRDDKLFIERMAIDTEPAIPELGHEVFLDQRISLTGVYDAVSNKTTWTLPYEHHDDVMVIRGTTHAVPGGRIAPLEYPTSTTVSAMGNFENNGPCYIGRTYHTEGELSKQYVRENNGDGLAIIEGRLQLKHITFSFKDSGYFEVQVTPQYRDTNVHKMTGRVLGDGNNKIGVPAIVSGAFKATVKSRGDTVVIKIVNDSHMPCIITSAAWVGFFNEISRQG